VLSIGADVVLRNVTIAYGYSTSSGGGCIRVSNASTLEMVNATVANCVAGNEYNGGGVYLDAASRLIMTGDSTVELSQTGRGPHAAPVSGFLL
jgi:hypothetical protein